MRGITLGERRKPTGGRRSARRVPAQRPAIVVDGIELEPVWFPHRDAKSLIPEGSIEMRGDYREPRGRIVGAESQSWSWLG